MTARGFLFLIFRCLIFLPVLPAQPLHPTGEMYDLVIRSGRVLDPASRFDSVATIGILEGRIAAISTTHLAGKVVLDASGLVVAPGFIDILSYAPGEVGVWNKIADGVTTNLSMHGGTSSPRAWYAEQARKHWPLNYGASFFYTQARQQFVTDRYAAARPANISRLTAIAERALQEGALGISFSLEYVPGISPGEIRPMMKLARQYNVPVFFHARYSDMEEPGTNLDALREIVGYARESGASVHIDHLNSTGGTFSMKQSLAMIDSARSNGLDVTACVYPYTYWGTYLNSARFDRGWQQRFHISEHDLQLGGSSERLTEESFAKYRRQGKLAIAYAIPEEDVEDALHAPYVMIGSDAILQTGYNNHPRASGAFSRTIAVYVRVKRTISLMDAIAKMTILPARRLEQSSDSMKRKGRLQIGADADIVIFDAARIRDRATVEHPERMSEGILYVIVDGQIVKDPKGLRKEVRPGRSIRGSAGATQN